MTAERSEAYGRALRLIDDKGPAALTPTEVDALRDAADAFLFGRIGDEGVRDARFAAEAIAARLTGSGRWSADEGERLLDALTACGPERVPVA